MTAIGVVLAGGRGRRLGGGGKALLPYEGRALIEWPLSALRDAGLRVVVVAKRDTELPADVEAWREPDEPLHPRTGLIEALRRAGGAPVLACPVDMPEVRAEHVLALLRASAPLAALAQGSDGRLQPLLGRYEPDALALLERAPSDESMTAVALRMEPARVLLDDAALHNVNERVNLR